MPIAAAKEIERVAEATGLSMQKVMQVMEMMQGKVFTAEPVPQSVDCKEDRMDKLRAKCNKAAFRLAKLRDIHVAEVHGKFKRQEDMTEQELQAKLNQLICECKKVI